VDNRRRPRGLPGSTDRRWRRYAVNLLLVVAGSVVALLLLELGLRVAGIGSDQFLRPDRELGVRFIPSKRGLSTDTCYRARVSINSLGWRGPEIPVAKPEGVSRVLVLGDSFMAGLQVGDEETFSAALERRLGQAGLPRRVEVLNLGVPSWGTDQEYLALRTYGLAFKPDLVLLAFYGQNDVSDNYWALVSAKSTYPKPHFDLTDDQLVASPVDDRTPWPIAVVREWAAHLRTYPLVRDSLLKIPVAHRVLYRLGIVGVVPGDAKRPSAVPWRWPERWRRQIGVYERNDDWAPRARAWAITEELLRRVRMEVEAAHATFVLLELPSPIAVLPPSLHAGLTWSGDAEAIDADKPSRQLTELARRRHLDLVSLVPAFRDRIGDSEAELERYYLPCDGHWTAAGHRLAADLVAPEIVTRLTRGAVQPPRPGGAGTRD
jgi:hypothetical protein